MDVEVIKLNFESLNKQLMNFIDEMIKSGYNREWKQILTYSNETSPIYSVRFTKEFQLEETDEYLKSDKLVNKYMDKTFSIINKYFKCSISKEITGSRYYFSGPFLDSSCDLWGMDFSDDKNPMVYIQTTVSIDKKLASEYKQKCLGQSPLIGTRTIN